MVRSRLKTAPAASPSTSAPCFSASTLTSPVAVICRSGNRSAYAAQALAARGLNTVNVSDGMTGWAVAGRPMVSEDGTEPHVA